MDNTTIVEALHRRYATKKFDPTKKIPQQDLDILFESLRLAPSAFGFQPWKFIHITDANLRRELKKHALDQAQVTDASDLIVIATKTWMKESDMDEYIQNLVATRKIPDQTESEQFSKAEKYLQKIKETISYKTDEEIRTWNQKQAYIAMWFLLLTCAEMGIDACPMEWFYPEKYNEVLWLDALGLTATLIIPVGYRSSDDIYAHLAKVRFPKEDMIIHR